MAENDFVIIRKSDGLYLADEWWGVFHPDIDTAICFGTRERAQRLIRNWVERGYQGRYAVRSWRGLTRKST
jgi:hypothetical protein